MEADFSIKPVRKAFLTFPFKIIFAIFFVPALIITLIITLMPLVLEELPFENSVLILIGLWGFVLSMLGITYATMYKAYEKTKTEFYPDKIVFYTGGLISENNISIKIPNITVVKKIKPLIKHYLFGVTTIRIQAAGSGSVEIDLYDLPDGDDIYDRILNMMRKKGFSLKRNKVLQQEKPSPAGILIQYGMGLAAFFLFFSIQLIFLLIFFPFQGLSLITGIIFIISLVYLKLTRKRYVVYEDSIEYYEDFLTKRHYVMPMENLAEANNTQSILSRIAGVHNVTITGQGDAKISFSNVPHGEALEELIDSLTKKYEPVKPSSNRIEGDVEKSKVQKVEKKSSSDFSGVYKQYVKRALVSGVVSAVFTALFFALIFAAETASIIGMIISFILVFFLVFIFVFVGVFIKANFTTYEVRKEGIYSEFNFISRRTQEFSDDKLVGLLVKRNLVDFWMGTVSITFQSLSNSQNITFKHIKNGESLLKALRKKYYLNTPIEKKIKAEYSIYNYLMKNFLIVVPITLLVGVINAVAFSLSQPIVHIISVILAFIWLLFVLARYLTYKNSELVLSKEHLEHVKGYFNVRQELVRYEDVKNQYSISYKNTTVGTLHVGIGGSSWTASGDSGQTQQNSQSGVFMANGFDGEYLGNVAKHLDFIDSKIINSKQGFGNPVENEKPAYKNAVVVHLILAPFTLGLSLLVLPINIWKLSRYSFHLEKTRIILKRGVWNRVKKSVLFVNIDHLTEDQGVMNKICDNGSVGVFTLGSVGKEMDLFNIASFKKWHKHIEKKYE